MLEPTARFTNKVDDYTKARPSYPEEIVPLLTCKYGLTSQSVIADMGSGTGLFTEVFLKHGNPVYGVEPNDAMRQAGEHYLKKYTNFISVNASAEHTSLASACCDFVVAGQAFHWFNPVLAKVEFQRVLKPNGWVILAWNVFSSSDAPLAVAYEKLFYDFGIQYQGAGYKNANKENLLGFLGPDTFCMESIPNPKSLDFSAFQSRVFSSSFSPSPGQPQYPLMQQAIGQVFEQFENNGVIILPYQTNLYLGQLK